MTPEQIRTILRGVDTRIKIARLLLNAASFFGRVQSFLHDRAMRLNEQSEEALKAVRVHTG